jgi:hypothetical protein
LAEWLFEFLEYYDAGVMEYWSIGVMIRIISNIQHSITPSLHYSKCTPAGNNKFVK